MRLGIVCGLSIMWPQHGPNSSPVSAANMQQVWFLRNHTCHNLLSYSFADSGAGDRQSPHCHSSSQMLNEGQYFEGGHERDKPIGRQRWDKTVIDWHRGVEGWVCLIEYAYQWGAGKGKVFVATATHLPLQSIVVLHWFEDFVFFTLRVRWVNADQIFCFLFFYPYSIFHPNCWSFTL